MEELITTESQEFRRLEKHIESLSQQLDELLATLRPSINGEHYLTSEEVCKLLRLSDRSLIEYRQQGIIPYTRIGGKILYPESGIVKTLQDNYINHRL